MLKNITNQQARFLTMLENNPSLENDMYFVNSLGQDRIIDTIRKLANITPLADMDKINYLYDLLSYVEIMLHGDQIEIINRGATLRPHAKQAIMSLMEEAHSIELESYRKAKESLQSEIEKLQQEYQAALGERDLLKSKNEELKSDNERLSGEVNSISSELGDLQKRRDALIAEGDRETQKIVDSRRQEALKELDEGINATIAEKNNELEAIKAEIEAQKKDKETIQGAVSETRSTLDLYQTGVANLLSCPEAVRWEHISENDPIYDTNYKTIKAYINSLKRVYMEKTGQSQETTDAEFEKNCPGINEFISLVCWFTNDELVATGSLRKILKNNDWNDKSKHKVTVISSMLSNFKLPQYSRENPLDFEVAMQNKTLPNNVQSLMTVLYWQRKAAEEAAARRIAEAELQAVVMTFKDAIPKDYNFGISDNARRAINNRTILEFLNSAEAQLKAPDVPDIETKPIEGEER